MMWLALTNRIAQLLYGVVFALPFVALRLAYGVTSLMLELDHSSSTFLTSVPIKVILSVVPEIFVTITLVGVGIMTRNINRVATGGYKHAGVGEGFQMGAQREQGLASKGRMTERVNER